MGKEHHEITHHKHYSSKEPTSLMAHIGQHKLWDQSHFALLKTLSSALMVSLLTSVIASPLKVKGVVVPLKRTFGSLGNPQPVTLKCITVLYS